VEFVFENHILYSANLYSELVLESEVSDKKLLQKQFESRRHNEREINLALNSAIEKNGPVHINVPFYEPLYTLDENKKTDPLEIFPDLNQREYSISELQPYVNLWNKAKRKIVLVGVMPPNSVAQKYLEQLAKNPTVLVLTETTSNLHHPELFYLPDSDLTHENFPL
jgi:2-succinyl-5-enolpyruvyl-6-hydroxy-3-cyclohexene-1-carboxylate synthase